MHATFPRVCEGEEVASDLVGCGTVERRTQVRREAVDQQIPHSELEFARLLRVNLSFLNAVSQLEDPGPNAPEASTSQWREPKFASRCQTSEISIDYSGYRGIDLPNWDTFQIGKPC